MKRIGWIFSILLVLFLVFPVTAHADIGPKPSVVITFQGIENGKYYVTLLSEENSTGPWSLGNPYYDYMGDEAAFLKFCDYEDVDGYYFLSYMQDCSDDDRFEWTYYPPEKFKVLIYYPEKDEFQVSSEIYERYAFDSYFEVDMNQGEQGNDLAPIVLRKSYDFLNEMLSLCARIILTILVELAIALLFGYRDKKNLRIISLTNICTQIILNVLLNVINYYNGFYAFVFHYVWMELLVMAIEGRVYVKYIDSINMVSQKEMHPVFYAMVANVASCAVGIWLANIIPGIF